MLPVKVKVVIFDAFLSFYKKQVFFLSEMVRNKCFLRFAAKLSIFYNSIPIEKLKTT